MRKFTISAMYMISTLPSMAAGDILGNLNSVISEYLSPFTGFCMILGFIAAAVAEWRELGNNDSSNKFRALWHLVLYIAFFVILGNVLQYFATRPFSMQVTGG